MCNISFFLFLAAIFSGSILYSGDNKLVALKLNLKSGRDLQITWKKTDSIKELKEELRRIAKLSNDAEIVFLPDPSARRSLIKDTDKIEVLMPLMSKYGFISAYVYKKRS